MFSLKGILGSSLGLGVKAVMCLLIAVLWCIQLGVDDRVIGD